MEDRKVVAWGEGHNSWVNYFFGNIWLLLQNNLFFGKIWILLRNLQVSGVAFDSYWSPPTSEDTAENVVYRFGSVGQVCPLSFSVSNLLFFMHRALLNVPASSTNYSYRMHQWCRVSIKAWSPHNSFKREQTGSHTAPLTSLYRIDNLSFTWNILTT